MSSIEDVGLPRWDVTELHESPTARSFVSAMEQVEASIGRLVALFDAHHIGAIDAHDVTDDDAAGADATIDAFNRAATELELVDNYLYAFVTTDSRDADAQAAYSETTVLQARLAPLLARLADWVAALGAAPLAERSTVAAEHLGPLLRLAERAEHQMSEPAEDLLAELTTTGSSAWRRLHADVTSQLAADVAMPGGIERLPMPAIRLATHPDERVRRAAYDAELKAWPTVALPLAAAINAIKGEANIVNRRRRWDSPLDASLFANSVGRRTFEAMQHTVVDALPAFRSWMSTKAVLHGHERALPWWDLFAPAPVSAGTVSWRQGVDLVRGAFASYSPALGGLVDRAIDESWIDAEGS